VTDHSRTVWPSDQQWRTTVGQSGH